MGVKKQAITIRITPLEARRIRGLARPLWPEEDLGVGKISRRLLLEHLLWAESERKLVGELAAGWEA